MNSYCPGAPPSPVPGTSSSASLVQKNTKTVPFLRSLTEMLLNNYDLISFVPGERSKDKTKAPARIIIHDRNRVQTEVLPYYFNHASFASFRRNLSYFSFVRLGKGRSSYSITYINHAVYEMSEILLLKRRAVGDSPSGAVSSTDIMGYRSEQYQQQQKQLGTSRDVASAVFSGRMHACETNHDLEAIKYQSVSVATSKSISAITWGTSMAVMTSSKVSRKKKRISAKHKRPRKGGPRLNRLLYVNNVVPFIHLPMCSFKAQCHRQSILKEVCEQDVTTSIVSKNARKRVSCSDQNGYKVKTNWKAQPSDSNSSGNEETALTSTESSVQAAQFWKEKKTSESVVSALLALREGQ